MRQTITPLNAARATDEQLLAELQTDTLYGRELAAMLRDPATTYRLRDAAIAFDKADALQACYEATELLALMRRRWREMTGTDFEVQL